MTIFAREGVSTVVIPGLPSSDACKNVAKAHNEAMKSVNARVAWSCFQEDMKAE